jgi:hypothetical protein
MILLKNILFAVHTLRFQKASLSDNVNDYFYLLSILLLDDIQIIRLYIHNHSFYSFICFHQAKDMVGILRIAIIFALVFTLTAHARGISYKKK